MPTVPTKIEDLPAATQLDLDAKLPLTQGGVTYHAQMAHLPASPSILSNMALLRVQQGAVEHIGVNGGAIDSFEDDSGVDLPESGNIRVVGGSVSKIPATLDAYGPTNMAPGAQAQNFFYFMKNAFMSGKTLTTVTFYAANSGAGRKIDITTFGADNIINAEYVTNDVVYTGNSVVWGGVTIYEHRASGLNIPVPTDGGFGICVSTSSPGFQLIASTTDVTTNTMWGRPVDPFDSAYNKKLAPNYGSTGYEMDIPRNVVTQGTAGPGVIHGQYEFAATDPMSLVTETLVVTTAPLNLVVAFVCSGDDTILADGDLTVEHSVDDGTTYVEITDIELDAVNATLNQYTCVAADISEVGTQVKIRVSILPPASVIFHGLAIFVS